MATDWEPYARHMMSVFSASSEYINKAGDNNYYPRPAERPITRFEARGNRLGHQVFDLVFVTKRE